MNDIATRRARGNEIAHLHKIWDESFDFRDRDLFFSYWFNPDFCIVAEHENTITAMGYLLPVGNLIINGEPPIPCAMIYAVAAHPEHRNRGFGTAVTAGLIKLARTIGYPAVVLRPSEDSLFTFYCQHTEMREWFFADELCLAAPQGCLTQVSLKHAPPEEYMHLRESLLTEYPHIQLTAPALQYQRRLCGIYGGNLFRFETPAGIGCAVIERQSYEIVCVKELLLSERCRPGKPQSAMIMPDTRASLPHSVISSIAAAFPAEKYVLKLPVRHGNVPGSQQDTTSKRHAMLTLPQELISVHAAITPSPWYGLAFD